MSIKCTWLYCKRELIINPARNIEKKMFWVSWKISVQFSNAKTVKWQSGLDLKKTTTTMNQIRISCWFVSWFISRVVYQPEIMIRTFYKDAMTQIWKIMQSTGNQHSQELAHVKINISVCIYSRKHTYIANILPIWLHNWAYF